MLLFKKIFDENAVYSFIFRKKKFSKVLKSSPVMRIWFHKIPFYHLNERILYTDYLISQKYKKCSTGKYAMLLYVAVSIRWLSIRFDAE